MKNMHKMHKKKQTGFTILEIGVVMVILISLFMVFSAGIWEKQTASDINLIQQFFESKMATAFNNCRQVHSNVLEGLDQADIRDCSGLSNNVVGIPWAAPGAVTNGLLVVTMDLSSMSEHTFVGTSVFNNLTANNYSHIDIANSSWADPVLTIQLRAR